MRKRIEIACASVLFVVLMIFQATALVAAVAPPPPPGSRTYTIYGFVKKSGTDTPISGATVRIYTDTGAYLGYTATSSTGYFTKSVTCYPPDFFEIVASKSGYQTATKYSAPSGTTCNVGTIYLTPVPITYTIHGYVRESDRLLPVSGATVRVYKPVLEGWQQVGTDLTDANGYFFCSYAVAETISSFRVVASASGYYDGSDTIQGTGTDFDFGDVIVFPIQTRYVVQGVVKNDETGQEVPGSTVAVWSYYSDGWNLVGNAVTNSVNGQFVLESMCAADWKKVRVVVSKMGFEGTAKMTFGLGPDYDFGTVLLNNPVDKYALVVGIDDYKYYNSDGDLLYSHDDANAWYEYLSEIQLIQDDHLLVYGDGHSENYVKYDGVASEHNVKNALIGLLESSDSNDLLCFIMTGHGGSSDVVGEVYLAMWDVLAGEDYEDGKFWDHEFAEFLGDAVAGRIFVFLSTCFSGGVIPEIQDLANTESFYVTTHCGPEGSGYQDPDKEMSLWTYWFLKETLRSAYDDDPTVALELAFLLADYSYHGFGDEDEPMQYDGNQIDNDFQLTT